MRLFIGLILHFVGDYLLQNNWLAQNKTKRFAPAIIHAMIYSVPFIYILELNTAGALIVMWSHFFIDRYRLAVYWIRLVNWSWKDSNYGYGENTPVWLSTWLLFIIDNIFHIIINSLCIYYLSL